MGLFTPRPEEPTEWAGLPSEPQVAGTAAETLPPPIDAPGGLSLLGAVESVVIPLEVPAQASPVTEESGQGDARA